MLEDQDEIDCSFHDQHRADEPDLYAEIDEIYRGIHDLQTREVADEERSKILLDLRTHFTYLEHVAILTRDSARLEPEFHQIELRLLEAIKNTKTAD